MKRKFILFFMMFGLVFKSIACNTDNKTTSEEAFTVEATDTIKLTAGSTTFTATLANNSSAKALKELLTKGDIQIKMSDYGNMEKVGTLGTTLPRNDEHITTAPGDLILYQGNAFVIYYAPNTWTFTRLGKINNVSSDELIAALGKGDITVTLSLSAMQEAYETGNNF